MHFLKLNIVPLELIEYIIFNKNLLKLACAATYFFSGSGFADPCSTKIQVNQAASNSLSADSKVTTKILKPTFFGFNLEWLEFQLGFWDASTNKVRSDVIHAFKEFPGAIYRFPGGINANHISWRDSTGPLAHRVLKPYVSWLAPLRAEFGPDEYLSFVREVNGQAWYVANLYGSEAAPRPLQELSDESRDLAQYLAKRAKDGAAPVLRWELGNELDRGHHKWSPAKLAQAANQVAAAVLLGDPGASFVHLQQEYPAQAAKGYSEDRYNSELRARLATVQPEYAIHLYYDGVPEAPSVDFFLKKVCKVVEAAKAEGSPGHIWITEHGRVPNGFWASTPKSMWPETANLTAAISMSDMLIGTTQIPEVLGAFTHSLVPSSSPWPLLHKQNDGSFTPSATLLAMKVLRRTMKPRVLDASQHSHGRGWQGAPYTVRSVALASDDGRALTLWSINRSAFPQTLRFTLKNSPVDLALTGALRIADKEMTSGNHEQPRRIQIDSSLPYAITEGRGVWSIELPANSVNAFLFD